MHPPALTKQTTLRSKNRQHLGLVWLKLSLILHCNCAVMHLCYTYLCSAMSKLHLNQNFLVVENRNIFAYIYLIWIEMGQPRAWLQFTSTNWLGRWHSPYVQNPSPLFSDRAQLRIQITKPLQTSNPNLGHARPL